MHASPFLSLLFLMLGHLLLPTFATPVRPDELSIHKRLGITGWRVKNGIVPAYLQTISPMPPAVTPSPTAATPTDTPTVPLNSTTSGDDSGPATEPIPASKAGSSLSSANAGVALAPREAMFFMVFPGVVATSLMF